MPFHNEIVAFASSILVVERVKRLKVLEGEFAVKSTRLVKNIWQINIEPHVENEIDKSLQKQSKIMYT